MVSELKLKLPASAVRTDLNKSWDASKTSLACLGHAASSHGNLSTITFLLLAGRLTRQVLVAGAHRILDRMKRILSEKKSFKGSSRTGGWLLWPEVLKPHGHEFLS